MESLAHLGEDDGNSEKDDVTQMVAVAIGMAASAILKKWRR